MCRRSILPASSALEVKAQQIRQKHGVTSRTAILSSFRTSKLTQVYKTTFQVSLNENTLQDFRTKGGKLILNFLISSLFFSFFLSASLSSDLLKQTGHYMYHLL
jgi:hypothetical protein